MPALPQAFAVGTTIAETYTIERVIGRGGMGVVLLATHDRLPGKRVALKVLHAELSDDEVRARFKREAQIASMLSHPNIVHIEDFNVTADGSPYLVLEYLQGESLAQRLAKGPLSIEQTHSIVRQVGSALAAAHAKGIVHRDLKPQNIFLVATEIDGAPAEVAKVLDFGISKMLDSHSVKTDDNALLGTPQYMAPEQANGLIDSIDTRTDVFAFGAIVYEMLSGRPAFAGSALPEIVFKVVYEQPAPLPEHVPPAIVDAVGRAMSKQREDRFATATGFVEAVTGKRAPVPSPLQPGASIPGQTTDPFARTVDPTRATAAALSTTPTAVATNTPIAHAPRSSRRLIVALVAAIVLAGVGVGLVVGLRGGSSERKVRGLDAKTMEDIASLLMDTPVGSDRYFITIPGETNSSLVTTTNRNLRKVAFTVDGGKYEAVEQNPETKSKWAKLAREGHKVVQFRDMVTREYIGVVVDGTLDTSSSAGGD